MASYQETTLIARGEELVEAGQLVYERGWVPATSGNLSARLASDRFAVTVSGRNKGTLTLADIMVVNEAGKAVDSTLRPSAETLLHTSLYARDEDVGAVLHTHSVNATLLSLRRQRSVVLEGYELLKAFAGITTHDARVTVPIFPNDQDIPRLEAQVSEFMDGSAGIYGYLIAGHGLYTWGRTVGDALRHLDAFEFLFQCELQRR